MKRKFKETDQFFMVGPYNVNFYHDAYCSNGKEFFGLEIIKFKGDNAVNRVWLYVQKLLSNSYETSWDKLHQEKKLDALISLKQNTKIVIL